MADAKPNAPSSPEGFTATAPHEPGTMDISVQEATFDAFVRWTGRSVIAIIVALILLYLING